MLSKISRQQDIIVGTPAANRRHADLEQIIGMFVNTLAMRNSPRAEITSRQFLKEVKTNTLAAFENQEYYIEDLVNKVVKTIDTSRNKLFSVMFALQNIDIIPPGEIAAEGEGPGLKAKPHDYQNRTAKFDLNFQATEKQDQLIITVEYSTKLFKEKTVQRFSEYFKEIVSVVLENNEIKLEDIDISCDLQEVAANLPETGFVF
jgi:non-ribosomal peptide synthetase component F